MPLANCPQIPTKVRFWSESNSAEHDHRIFGVKRVTLYKPQNEYPGASRLNHRQTKKGSVLLIKPCVICLGKN